MARTSLVGPRPLGATGEKSYDLSKQLRASWRGHTICFAEKGKQG
jgi:hypothetical protein